MKISIDLKFYFEKGENSQFFLESITSFVYYKLKIRKL